MSKYQRWHDQIIDRARHRTLDVYKERHHVRPRCLGGGDEPENLVDLTYREHFLIHWLLTRLHEGRAKMLMFYALHAMTLGMGPRVVTGWQIEVCKRAFKRQALARLARRREARKAKRNAERERREGRFAQLQSGFSADSSRASGRAELKRAATDWLKGEPEKIKQLMRQPLGKPKKRRGLQSRTVEAIKRERRMEAQTQKARP